MPRRHSHPHRPHGARPAAKRPAPGWLAPAAVYGVPVAAALWIHLGALGAFFTVDDLILLERASGLAPFPATLWRWLSGQAYFRLLWPVFGAEPFGWHVIGWLLHGLATGLVALWARRLGANRTTAALAALLFGTSARARVVVWPVTGIGDGLAAVFALLVLASLAGTAMRTRRGAVAWHAAALLSKETVALAPLAALAGRAPGVDWRTGLRDALPPLALSVAAAAYVVFARGSTGSLGGDAYALGFGRHILDHLLTYTLWTADPVHAAWAIGNPPPLPWAVVAVVLLAGLAHFAWRSGSRAARAGLVLWVATLLPVLPLVNVVYEHYLYLPKAGMALAIAAAVAGHAGAARRWAWAGAGFLAAVHALTAMMFLGATQHVLIPELGLPRDAFLRRMEVIRNAAASVRGRFGTGPVRLVVYTPPGAAKAYDARTGARADTASVFEFRQNLVEAALDGGRGLRVFAPALSDVRFTERPSTADSGCVLATNIGDGRLAIHGPAPAAHAVMADFWESRGYAEAAAGHRAAVAALDSAAAASKMPGR